jgi:uncharacterized protein YqeY
MVGKNKGNRLSTEDEVISTVQKFLKNAEEVKRILESKGQTTKVVNEEIIILKTYLPTMFTEDGLKVIIQSIIDSGKDNMGLVMDVLKRNYNGMYDGKVASQIVKELLK